MEFWMARDRNGTLGIFKDKPVVRRGVEWCSEGEEYLCITTEDSFPDVTFENSPKRVEIVLVDP